MEACRWASVHGLAAAPAAAPWRSDGPGVLRIVSQLSRVDFFCVTVSIRVLRHDDGGVSILNVHGGGHPRRTAYGCTSHVLLRNVFPTCISRLRGSKRSCDLWIAARRASAAWNVEQDGSVICGLSSLRLPRPAHLLTDVAGKSQIECQGHCLFVFLLILFFWACALSGAWAPFFSCWCHGLMKIAML